MPSNRGGDAWSRVLGTSSEEEPAAPSAVERTVIDERVLAFDDDGDPTPVDGTPALSDPVLAAMAELDGAKSLPRLRAPRAAASNAPKLRLPTPSHAAGLTVPQAPASPRAAPSLPIPTGDLGAPTGFSAGALLDHLEEGPADAPPSTPAAGAAKGHDWREYKELIFTAAGGLVLLASVIFIQYRVRASEAPPPKPLVAPVAAPVAPAPVPTPAPARQVEEPKIEPQPRPRLSATPMLTVVTKPSGALVEIDGVIYGRTPLILPAPRNPSLAIVLKADDHKRWEQVVTPNEAGHYSVNVELIRLR